MADNGGWLAVGRWLHRRAEDVSVALLGTMFVVFLLQIVFRYLLVAPLSWSDEVTLICWLWGVLWGAGVVLSDDDEIRLDIVYSAVPEPVRRVFTAITGVAVVVLLVISLPASWKYVAFMKVERTSSLRIPLNYAYSVFVIFAVACIIRYCRLVWIAVRGPSQRGVAAELAEKS
jgi:TRAP-type C4-dicarboxylate transport system permease small subunit